MFSDTVMNSLFLGVDSLGQSLWNCLIHLATCLQSLTQFLEGLVLGSSA